MASNRIGLVLGSGSARGWAHIGVIRALAEAGIKPDIVCGSSIGALVGAAYASGNLDELESWVRELSFWDVVRLLDIKMQGGLIEGVTLMDSFHDKIRDINIENLNLPYAAVATDLGNGHEVWLKEGELLPAVRASIALPGLFSPTRIAGRWLVDGGLVNPVPVSLGRAMGADFVIAVNLNSDMVGRHSRPRPPRREAPPPAGERDLFGQLLQRLNSGLRDRAINAWRSQQSEGDSDNPLGMFEVLARSINIMQDRITKSRMVGDPPDLMLTPHLGQLGLLEFDRAGEAIEEGVDCVKRQLPQLQRALEQYAG